MTPEEARLAVDRGAAFMDKADPGWWREDVPLAIDLDKFWMERSDSCILGQRCPLEILGCRERSYAYDIYARHLSGIGPDDPDALRQWVVEYGFNAWDLNENSPLEAAWKDLITGRRKVARRVAQL